MNIYSAQFLNRSLEVRRDALGWRVSINHQLAESVYATERCAMGAMESAAQEYYIAQANREFKEKYGV
jgi:hypothetical protein